MTRSVEKTLAITMKCTLPVEGRMSLCAPMNRGSSVYGCPRTCSTYSGRMLRSESSSRCGIVLIK
eukprot:7073917-Prymnesium_polylepis.2